MTRGLLLGASLVVMACQGAIVGGMQPGETGGGGANGTGAGAAGGGSGGSGTLPGDLPCDVATVLADHCTTCHGVTPSGGATFSLASRADLLRELSPGQTAVARSIARMQLASAPMPPSTFPAAAPADITVLEQWVAAGTPTGTCMAGSPDAGPPPLTCLSQSTWTSGNLPSDDMNPGLACQACHLGRNVRGQNPTLESQPERAYLFMGTVFRGPFERDLCNAALPGDVEVEIIGSDGLTITRMLARAGSGNFFSDGERPRSDRLLLVGDGVALPYTAKVRANGQVREMRTPQMSGDCNDCHGERGSGGAPGRIVTP